MNIFVSETEWISHCNKNEGNNNHQDVCFKAMATWNTCDRTNTHGHLFILVCIAYGHVCTLDISVCTNQIAAHAGTHVENVRTWCCYGECKKKLKTWSYTLALCMLWLNTWTGPYGESEEETLPKKKKTNIENKQENEATRKKNSMKQMNREWDVFVVAISIEYIAVRHVCRKNELRSLWNARSLTWTNTGI